MRRVYEHEVRTTTLGSPIKDETCRESNYRVEGRRSRSPISASRRVADIDRLGSGRKTVTTTYEGADGMTTTVVRRSDEPEEQQSPNRYTRIERSEVQGDGDQVRTTTYTSRVESGSGRKAAYDKYSPSRTQVSSGTKVVYEGDPSLTEYITRHIERSQLDPTATSGSKSYRRTTIERSPLRRVERTIEYTTEDDKLPERETSNRLGDSQKSSAYKRSIREGDRDVEVSKSEFKYSPTRTVETKITRESPTRREVTEIARIQDQPENSRYTRTVRESSPAKYEVTTRVVRDSPVSKKETVTRIVREDEDGVNTSTYIRRERPEPVTSSYVRTEHRDVELDGARNTTYTRTERREADEPRLTSSYIRTERREQEDEPRETSSYSRTLVNKRDGEEVRTVIRTEYSPSQKKDREEDYPRRAMPLEEDVVVLKYTSPYRK